MAYLTREDIPFHYALADAFTICDAYHCSMLSSTDPNRYYMYTGYSGNDGKGGGPVLGNEEKGYGWTTFPEILEQAGVSWKVYQDTGTGLDAAGGWGWTSDAFIGNYGDNSLLYFNQYRNAQPGNPLYDKARTGTNVKAGDGYFDQLKADVLAGKLPQVSWIAAPEAFCEHPNWPANYGAWYVSQVLDALTADPDVWSRTARLPHLRRERRLLRPRGAALPARLRRPRPVHRRRHPGPLHRRRVRIRRRAVRARAARADAGPLAVEHRRLGVLPDLRPHLDRAVHREAVRRAQPERLALAPRGLRRPHRRLRLHPQQHRRARAPRHRRLRPAEPRQPRQLRPGPAGDRHAAQAGAGPAQRPRPALRPGRRHATPGQRADAVHLQQPRHGGRGLPRHLGGALGRPLALHGRGGQDPHRHLGDARRRRPATTSRSTGRTASCAGWRARRARPAPR